MAEIETHKLNEVIKDLQGKSVYFDANPIIYFLEGNAKYAQIIQQIFQARQDDVFQAVTGHLCLAELLVKPVKDNNQILIQHIKQLFQSGFIALHAHHQATFELSASIRAKTQLKMPDALHVATAINCGADVFLTADNQISNKVAEIAVMNLNDLLIT